MSDFKGKLLPTQHAFVSDFDNRETAFIGGYGAGKSVSACCKALTLASKNQGYAGCILSPTYGMLTDTLIPTMEQVLKAKKVKYDFRSSPQPFFLLYFRKGTSKIFCRSAENYRRLASLNLAWAVVDEADLIKKDDMISAWKMLQSRLRTGKLRQLCATSTPEGFEGAYHLFVKDNKPYRKIYKAKTTENYHLPQDYIENLYASYSPQEIEAYINGEFVNLTSGTVYYGFDRKENHTDKTAADFIIRNQHKELRPVLHIGCDFNVGQTSGMVCVVKDKVVYVVDEFTELRDTEALIQAIKARYDGYKVIMYPDSSGKSGSTATTISDIAQLKTAFGATNVKYPSKNPKILNRVKSLNARILNSKGERRLFVNTTMCETLTSCLEQQTYDKGGLPDKSNNLDHPLDALGYAIWTMFPIIPRGRLRNFR